MANYTSGSPGSSSLEIGIALVLQDRFSNQAREASNTIRTLHRDAKNAINANLQAALSGASSIQSIGMGIARGLSDTVLHGAEFIDTMTMVSAITGSTEQMMSQLSDTAQTLGLQTMFDSQEIASGMKFLAMAGNEAKDINEMIKGAAYVAGATGMELGGKGGTADMITNVMRMFKIEASEASTVVGDQLAKAAMASNVSMMDLAQSIKYAGADMVTLKQDLPQVAAMIGTLGNAGIQGSMAGTAIANMARYFNKSISDPNFKGGKTLEKLGLSKQDFVDAKGDILDFSVILEKLKNATQDLTSTDRNAVFLNIFGVRGNRAAVALMNDLEGYRDLLNKIQNESQGFSRSVVEKRMNTLAGSIDIMRSSLENLRTTFAESIEPILVPVFKAIGTVVGYVRDLLNTPVLGTIISTVFTLGTALTVVGSTLVILRARWKLFTNDSQVSFKNMISLLIGGWNGASLSAMKYLQIERSIIAQRKAGILGSPLPGILNSTGKTVEGLRTNKAGRVIDAKTGRFVSKQAIESVSTAAMTKAMLEGQAKSAAATAAKTAVGAGVGRTILGFGSKLFGFLGGPWGLALIGVSTILPMVIDSLKSTREANQENTKSIYTLAGKWAEQNGEKTDSKDATLTQEQYMLVNAMKYWTQVLQNIKPSINLTLNVDGKKAMQEVIDEDNKKVNLNMATK